MSIIRSAGIVAMLGAFVVPTSLSQILFLDLYTTREGMVANSAHTFLQDSDGYLWIGTGDGVSRYDGLSFQNLTVNDGLPLNLINCIAETRGRTPIIWFGTNGGGLGRLAAGTLSTVVLDTIPSASVVSHLAVDSSGVLWCATRGGIYALREDSVSVHLRFGEPGRSVAMAVVAGKELWVGMDNTLIIYSTLRPADPPKVITLPRKNDVHLIHQDRDSGVWIASGDGNLSLYHGTTQVHSRRIGSIIFSDITDDHSGSLWIATRDSGLYSLPKAQFTTAPTLRYGTQHGLPDNRLRTVYCDRENNLWIGPFSGGFSKWANRGLITFPVKDIPDAYNNGRAVADSSGHCWVVTRRSVVEVWKDSLSRWRQHEHPLIAHPIARPVRFIVIDRSGDLWIDVADEGIRRYEVERRPGASSVVRLRGTLRGGKELPLGSRQGMVVDRHGLAWVSVHGVGVAVVDLATWALVRTYGVEDGSPGASVRALHEDSEGRVWAGGFFDGVAIFPAKADPRQPVGRLDEIVSLPDNQIRALTADDRGRIWVGGRYGGLAMVDGGTVTTVTMKDGLTSNTIWGLASGHRNLLWCATSLGLQAVDTEHFLPLPNRIGSLGESVNSCGVYRDQYVWYVTLTELVIYESPSVQTSLPPPLMHVNRVFVNGALIDHDAPLEVSHDQSTWAIEYIGISLRDEKSVRYRYRLRGLDDDWSLPTAERSVTYAALAPGRYTFEVMTLVGSAMAEAIPARLSFSILPPMWQRTWFILASIVLASSAGGLLLRGRARRRRREEERQVELSRRFVESQESERRRIANELHDSLGQELLVLKSDLQHLASRAGGNAEMAETLARLSEDVMQSINEVRQISYDLHPHVLERLGLCRAIESIVTKTSQSSGLAISCTVEGIDNLLPKRMEINLYRIVQEGLNNIIKHAAATEAVLEVVRRDGHIMVRLQDNGRGFDPDHQVKDREKLGLGLAGIAERVRLSGGTWSIASPAGQGTTLRVTIPAEGGNAG